jgi:hypothetical protein
LSARTPRQGQGETRIGVPEILSIVHNICTKKKKKRKRKMILEFRLF